MYQILGTYKGKTEVLDCFETLGEATRCLAEYRLAYGPNWVIDLKRAA